MRCNSCSHALAMQYLYDCVATEGKLSSMVAPENQGDPSVKRGQEAPRCGVKDGCGPDAFPVHLYTGIGNSEGPKICVSGK